MTKGAQALRGKWVYTHKKKDGKVKYAKARYVAQGCFQTEGVDFDSTYSSVMTITSFRMLLSIANSDPKFNLGHVDVTAAFVMASREIPAYCEQPAGHEVDKDVMKKLRLVWKLLKCLYGLKDSGFLWQKTFVKHMSKMGFEPLKSDPAIYILRRGSSWVLLGTYVDDTFICDNDSDLTKEVVDHMASAWKIKYDPDIQWALNLRVFRDREKGILKVSQEAYIKELLTKFGMQYADGRDLPHKEGAFDLDPDKVTEEEVREVSGYRFRELIGSLLWIATVSRPDICFAVVSAARCQHRPSKRLWSHLTRILQYLKKYPDIGLVYVRNNINLNTPLEIYVDVSFASEVKINKGKSIVGYVVKFLGNTIAWSSSRSRRVTLSATEAECNGFSEAIKENIWQRCIASEIGLYDFNDIPTPIYEDNSGTRTLCDSKTYHKRSKHFGLEWYHTKERIAAREAIAVEVSTDRQHADMLTKGLPRSSFHYHRQALMGPDYLQAGMTETVFNAAAK